MDERKRAISTRVPARQRCWRVDAQADHERKPLVALRLPFTGAKATLAAAPFFGPRGPGPMARTRFDRR
jgi:hypothetical protein